MAGIADELASARGILPAEPGDSVATLVDRCLDGHEEAWYALVDRYESLVFSVARREGLAVDDACDVTQSVFLALFNQLAVINDPDRLAGWLATVTRRTVWRHRRRTNPSPAPTEFDVDKAVSPNELDKVDERLDLHRAVSQLDEPCRTLVIALFFEPVAPSYSKIALRIGRPVGSIGPLRGRCLVRLRDCVGEVRS